MVLVFVMAGSMYASGQMLLETVITKFQAGETAPSDLVEMVADMDKVMENPKAAAKPKAWFYRGLVYYKVLENDSLKKLIPNSLENATEAFTKTIALDKRGTFKENCRLNLLNLSVEHYYNGNDYLADKKYDKAIESFKKTAELLEFDTEDQMKQQNLTKELAMQLAYGAAMDNNDNATAIPIIEGLIAGGGVDPRDYYNLARIHLGNGDTAKALETVEAGLDRHEGNSALVSQELDLYLKQGKTKELLAKLDKAIELDPGNKVYYFARGIARDGTGAWEGAEADYMKAIEIDPDYYDAHFNLGVVYLNQADKITEEERAANVTTEAQMKPYDDRRAVWYVKAIPALLKSLENEDMPVEDKLDLYKTIRRLYNRMGMDSEKAEIQSIMDELSK